MTVLGQAAAQQSLSLQPVSEDSWKSVTNRQLLEKLIRNLRAEADHWETVLAKFNQEVLDMTQEDCHKMGVNIHFYTPERI